uniref:Uncharacterized protein n=1 Tax=viral metagenome TaxID=1070528 RepID=A0A6M3XY73_9ZZZZ
MLFEQSITITAGKTKADPQVEILKIAHGIITKIMVRPRPGHHGLAHCVILHHEHQIAPSTEGMDFAGDTFPIDWEEYYECYQPPYELKIKGWNDDDTYSHTFDIFVAILPRKAIVAPSVADTIKEILGMLSPKRIFTGKAEGV